MAKLDAVEANSKPQAIQKGEDASSAGSEDGQTEELDKHTRLN